MLLHNLSTEAALTQIPNKRAPTVPISGYALRTQHQYL